VVKNAFTLIELIFAIVIIAIAVISLPTMNQATMKGIEGNMVQEVVFAASTELNQVITAHWDDNSLEPAAPNSPARVIDIFAGAGRCETNSSLSTYRQMAGHIDQPLHRRCLDSNTTGLAAGAVLLVDDLDDRMVTGQTLSNAGTGEDGYKLNFTTDINVTNTNVIFGTDQVNANPNMKRITVTIKDTAATPKIITSLVTYSANIGEIDYYKRSY